jgi:hypothetical protein
MSEGEAQRKAETCSIWCDKRLLKEFKAAVKASGHSIVDEFNDFFMHRTAELNGSAAPNSTSNSSSTERDYENLTQERDRAVSDVEKRVKRLSQHPDFQKANQFLHDLELLNDFSNIDEVLPKFIAQWSGTDQDFKVEYVDLIKASVRKRQLTKKLAELQTVHPVSEPDKTATLEPSASTVETVPATETNMEEPESMDEEDEPEEQD